MNIVVSRRPLRTLESRRLTLVAASSALVQADLDGAEALAGALGADAPEDWPPELFEAPAMRATLEQLRDAPEQGWSVWYLLSEENERSRIVGICGFKGRPDASGSVEISYSVLPGHRDRGFASEAVARLLVWAFSHQDVVEVTADTLPHLLRSIRVLEKNGFTFSGRGSEYGVVRYAVSRPDGR